MVSDLSEFCIDEMISIPHSPPRSRFSLNFAALKLIPSKSLLIHAMSFVPVPITTLLLLLSALLLSLNAASLVANEISIRILPTPIANGYHSFEFSPLQTIPPQLLLSFITRSPKTLTTYPFINAISVNYRGVFSEEKSQSSAHSTRCFSFNPDDVDRLSPTDAGSIETPPSSGKNDSSFRIEFISESIIPANWIVSCLVELLVNNRPQSLPLSIMSRPGSWTPKHSVDVPGNSNDVYSDLLSYIDLSLRYIRGDAILAGERLDIIEFEVQSLPANVMLPITAGLDTAAETNVNRIYYLSPDDIAYIGNLWGSVKSGTSSPHLTPDDPEFYDQSWDVPSPYCGFDVRLVFSRPKKTIFLVTGEKPAQIATCRIPIPIFYLHGSIARFSGRRQNLHVWSGTQISSYIQLNERLFKHSEAVGNPQWWFRDNPHIAQYSTQDTQFYDEFLPSAQLRMLTIDFQLIFIGTSPTIRFDKFFAHSQYNIQRFFTVSQEETKTDGFLKRFSYVTTPTHISSPSKHTDLVLNMTHPFTTTYTFDDVFNGYLSIFITFSIPAQHFSPFSLQLVTHAGKVLHLTQSPEINVGVSTISNMSDTSFMISSVLKFDAKIKLPSNQIPINRENYYMFPFTAELTYSPLSYEIRPPDNLLPKECTVEMYDMSTRPPTPFTPAEAPQVEFQPIPVLAGFSQDSASSILVKNLHTKYETQITFKCTFDAIKDRPKPPLVLTTNSMDLPISCFHLDFGQDLCSFNKAIDTPSTSWTPLPLSSRTRAPALFRAYSPKPITSQQDLDDVLRNVIQILNEALVFQSKEILPSMFKNCVELGDFYQIFPFITPSTFPISASYVRSIAYPKSFSASGWTDPSTDGADWRDNMTLESLSIHSNASLIEFVVDITNCPTTISQNDARDHTFFSSNGLIVKHWTSAASWFSFQLPRLEYNVDLAGSETAQPDIARKWGGMRCYSHMQCNWFNGDDFGPFNTCYRGFCTTDQPRLTPFEFRLFNAFASNQHSHSLISIDTTHDYTPLPDHQSFRRFIFYIGGPVLAIGLSWLIYEAVQYFKLRRRSRDADEAELNNLLS